MKVTIDRFEGNFAVVELPDQTMLDVPKLLFPNAVESDVIDITIDKNETNERIKRISELMNELYKD
jgi:c-di-GMP-related signal transduction protein